MIALPELQTALIDLLSELRNSDLKLIIGGGYGIYLKTEYIRRTGARTLFHEWPESRSTNDLDVFLRPELLIDSARLKPLSAALTSLNYRVVAGAAKYQFIKAEPGGIKIDLLTGPQSRFVHSNVKTDARRVRPHPSVGIHAHPVDETPTLEEGLLTVPLNGKLTSGAPWQAEILLPHPFTYLMMKLFAFRDRFNDEDKDYGRYHALDLYTILATTMETEWEHALQLCDERAHEPLIIEAGNLVREYFSALNKFGMIRLRESPYHRSELQLDEFMSALAELFPAR